MYRTEDVQTKRDYWGYRIMGTLAMLVMFLAPPVLVALTFLIASIAGADLKGVMIACGVALAISLVISYIARGFGRTASAIVHKAKYGVEPPWNR